MSNAPRLAGIGQDEQDSQDDPNISILFIL